MTFKAVQVPAITKASVPFLGVNGMTVTKYATTHNVDAAAKDLVVNFFSTPSAQTRSPRRAAGLRRTSRRRRPTRSWPSSARPARAASRCRTSRRWAASGAISARRGSARRRAQARCRQALLHRRGPLDRVEDRLSRAPRSGRPTGRPLHVPTRPSVSSATPPRRARAPRLQAGAGAAGGRGLLGSVPATRSRSRCSASRTPSRPGRSTSSSRTTAGRASAVLIAATALIDWVYLVPRKWTLPAKFLIPGTVFLIGFQVVPILYTINVAFSNYSIGHILTKGQAIDAIKVNSLEPAAEQPAVRHGGRALVRATRPDPPRRGRAGRSTSGTAEGPDAAAKGDVTLGRPGRRPRRRATRWSRVPSSSRSTSSSATSRCRRPAARDPAAGHLERRRALADAALRPEDQHVRADQRRDRVPRQRARLVRLSGRDERSSRAGRHTSASATSAR